MIAEIQAALARGDAAGAAASARTACGAFPDVEACWVLLASALAAQGQYAGVEAAAAEGLALHPASFDLTLARVSGARHTLRPEVAADALRALVARRPDFAPGWACLAQQLNYTPGVAPADVLATHRRFGAVLERAAGGQRAPRAVTLEPERRLRVAILSADLARHSVAHFLLPLVEHWPGDAAMDLELIFTGPRADEITRRFAATGRPLTQAGHLPPEHLAQLIWSRRTDIVIECNGPADGSRLSALALRPAPLQMTYCGYPATTGCGFVDARIVDARTDPPDAGAAGDAQGASTVERLVRLPGCFLVYAPLDPLPAREGGSARGGAVTFGCFNQLAKLNHETLDDWAAILGHLPGARLLLKAAGLEHEQPRREVLEGFAARGIDPGRIEVVGWIADPAAHLALYRRVDIALDTFPYHGTTTTCEALAMGVPVVTRAGVLHAGRVGVSLLAAAGLSDLVTTDREAYIARAAALAGDRGRLRELGRQLPEQVRRSVLMDARGFAGGFVAALREAWRVRCRAG